MARMAGSPAAVVVEPAPEATRPPADMLRAPFRLAIYTEAVARGGAEMNLANVIRSLEPGQQVSISWITSSGKTRTATVTLGSSPVN